MEKAGLIKTLRKVKVKEQKIEGLTTDRHLQIKKYMCEQEEDIDDQFDVWHFSKSIKTKLVNASKNKTCEELTPWVELICNHFWWACAICENDKALLKGKSMSIIFHIQNKHTWTGNTLYHQCSHGELSREDSLSKDWISPKSQAFQALQSIVFNKTILKDMVHVRKFSHTGVLEVYDSVLNK